MTSGRWFKLACVGLYAGIVGLATLHVQRQAVVPHSKTTRIIGQSQPIGEADIVPIDRKDIVGHYAVRAFEAGEKITPKDVSAAPRLPPAGAIAVVVSVRRPAGAIDVAKVDVQVCLDDKPIGKPAKPIASVCDNNTCVVTIPMDDLKELAVPGAAKRLRGIPPGPKCDSSPGISVISP